MNLSALLQYSKYVLCIATALGFFLPFLSSAIRPFLLPLLALNVAAAVLRMEFSQIRADLQKVSISIFQPVWLMIVSPAVVLAAIMSGAVPENLHLPLLVFSSAAPMTSTPALALLLRARLAFVLIGLVIGNMLMPLTTPLFIAQALPPGSALDVKVMMLQLLASIGAAIVLGLAARITIGARRVGAWAGQLDAASLVLVSLISIAVMDQGLELTLAYPIQAAQTLIAVVVTGLLLASFGYFIFYKSEKDSRVGAALNSGLPNVGIVLAIIGASATTETIIMVATTQTLVCILPFVFARRAARPQLRTDKGTGA